MALEIGQNALVYDPRMKDWHEATIKDIRTNVPSSFDFHIYPILYDVEFLTDGYFSKGHLPFALKRK